MPFSAVWSGPILFAILSSLIRVYTICHSFLTVSQCQHCLSFWAVWSGHRLFAILSLISIYTICHSQQSDQGLHYFPFFVSRMTTVYTVRHSQHSDHGLHNLPFTAVSSRSKSTMSFSVTVWSGSTLFAILSSLSWSILSAILSSLIKIRDHTVFLRNSLIRFYTLCNSQQSDQGLHCLPFSAVWSGSTLFAILISLIRNYTICHSF